MKTALLVISFGTTHLDTLEKTIHATEKALAVQFPEYTVYRAFTSGMVRKRLMSKYEISVDSTEEALSRISRDGFESVIVLPTLLIPGEEYNKLLSIISSAAGSLKISVCEPLLYCEKDLDDIIRILHEAYPTKDDTTLLLMGHGTEHSANDLYIRLAEKMRSYTGCTMRLCTVEGTPSFEDAINELSQMPQKNIKLAPLMFVAGDHAKNDMAGDKPDSLCSILENKSFFVDCYVQGLGEIEAVQQMYASKVRGFTK